MDDSKPKRKNHPSRIRRGWNTLQIRSLRMCIALFTMMTIHGALLLIAHHTATDDFTLYLYNTFHLFLILLLAVVFFTIVYTTYRVKRGILLLIGVVVYAVVWFLLPVDIFWTNNWPVASARIDTRVYHLSAPFFAPVTIADDFASGTAYHYATREYTLYECDGIGLVCRVVTRQMLEDDAYTFGATLEVDAATNRLYIIRDSEIMYAYPEADS